MTILINSGYFRDGKMINPWPWMQKRLNKSKNARCEPFLSRILHLNVEGLSENKICVISVNCLSDIRFVTRPANNTTLHTAWLGLKKEAWP